MSWAAAKVRAMKSGRVRRRCKGDSLGMAGIERGPENLIASYS
jgi:hypothetical protein